GNRIDERRRTEMPRRREMEIAAEILHHALAGGIFVRGFHPIVPVIDAPDKKRQAFAQVTENDLQARILVEQAAADEPQSVQRSVARKTPRRPEQPGVALIERQSAWHGRARVQIERHIEIANSPPERTILRHVIMDRNVRAFHLRIAVYQRAAHSEIANAAMQLAR